MAQFITSNAPQVLKSSKATKQQVTAAMHWANKKTADQGATYVQEHIPPGKNRGSFPGYAATGALRNAVQTRGPLPFPGGVKSEIFMANDRTRRYQYIHEFGGIIRARAGGWLRFPKPPAGAPRNAPIAGNRAFEKGGYVFAKAVRIKAKHYWRDGWAYGKKRFDKDFAWYLKVRLPR
jgi:hypothetical protein